MRVPASGRVVFSFVLSSVVGFLAIAGTPILAEESEGPSEFRRSAAPSASLAPEELGLSIAWDRELGSGYSNIVVVDGKSVTAFTAGEVDVLAAFDSGTGEEIWRHELGPKYAGHSGSDDGPLSTPAISGDRVFALSGHGRLVAVDFESGEETWSHQLDESTSTPPYYGYSTSPVTVGDLVVLATGGEGRAVTAFDHASGEVRWTAGSDSVRYQTPLVTELGGQETIVAVTDNQVLGIAPETGEVLFEVLHGWDGRTSESAQATSIDGERFVANSFDGSTLYRRTDDGVEEVWRSRAFANSVAIPVLYEGHLYGFTGRFLTCAAVETGEIVWRSRPPGALGISLVGDKLAVVAQSGELVLVAASPDGYREITRLATFERGDYATPTFVDDHFLVRNLERLAAVRVDASATPRQAEAAPTAEHLLGELKTWALATLALPESERQAAVDARFAEIEASPFFEEGGIAHFFWRGEAEDVGLDGQEISSGADNALHRIPGTDLFLRSAELDVAGQYTYQLTIDYEEGTLDPRNEHSVDNGNDQVSEVRMPEWPRSPHLDPPAADAPRGELDTFPFRSEILDNTRQIQVWRPPGYGSDPETRYPVLVVNHGDNLLRGGLMRNTLDNLVGGEEVAPLVAVFVPRSAGPEYGGERVDDYVRFLTDELLPHVDRHYLTGGEHRAIMGPGSGGVTAVYAALQRPDVFQRAAAQSFVPMEPSHQRIEEMVATAGPRPELIALVWSPRDYDLGEGRTAASASQALADRLRAGSVPVQTQVSAYTPGWGGWRGQHDDLLAALFPLEGERDEARERKREGGA